VGVLSRALGGFTIGSHMNFLMPLSSIIHPNADMTPEQLASATEFVDELVTLGVLEATPDVRPVLTNAPIFTLKQPGFR
jgi:hypothetical protein